MFIRKSIVQNPYFEIDLDVIKPLQYPDQMHGMDGIDSGMLSTSTGNLLSEIIIPKIVWRSPNRAKNKIAISAAVPSYIIIG